MYLAVLEPTILYAAREWASAARKLLVRRSVGGGPERLRSEDVRIYRTASLNSALILAGLLPLDLRVQEAAHLFKIKRGYSRQVVGDRDLELPVSYLRLPHPSGQLSVDFSCLEEGEEAARLATALFTLTAAALSVDKVSAAFCVMRDVAQLYSKKLKLGSYCTVYQVELLALAEATGYAASGSAQSCAILSDSRSALQTAARSDTLHPLAVRVKENVMKARENGKSVRFYWVDQLAKDAALKNKCKPVYEGCPISIVKRQLRLETLHEWNRRYVSGARASVARIFFSNATQAYRVLRKVEVDTVLVQLFTGHGGFSEYLYRFKLKEDPSCFCEPGVDQTAIHLVAECPAFGGL
ncbi:uncharacterized protein [Battus philenor]|uniref:uncharacterized protein n=1 Tax=Battus philenor TaxID=42288 RepID=UPI0035CFAB15